MIFIPNYTPVQYPCVVVQSNGVLRAYRQMPANNRTVDYVDFYLNSDYMSRNGQQQFSSNTTLPSCLAQSEMTNNFMYRIDFHNIVLLFTLLAFMMFYLPAKLILRLFIRR